MERQSWLAIARRKVAWRSDEKRSSPRRPNVFHCVQQTSTDRQLGRTCCPKTQAVHNVFKFWTHCPEASQNSGCPQWVQILDPLSRSVPKAQAVHNGSKFGTHCPEASEKLKLSTMDPLSRSLPKTQAVHNGIQIVWTHCPEASQILRLSTIGPNFGPIVLKPPKNSGWPQWVQILDPLSRSLPKTQAVHNGSKFWTHCPEASQKLRLFTMGPNFGPIVQKPLKNSGRPKKPAKNSGCPQ